MSIQYKKYYLKLLITAIILIEINYVSSSPLINSNDDSVYFDNNTNNDYIIEVLRRYQRQATINGENCEIPVNPPFTTYKVLGELQTNYIPGDFAKQYNVLEINCNKGYALRPLASNRLICINGNWSDPPPACIRTCPSLISTDTTTVACRYNNIPLKNCINPVKETIAVLSCNTLYEEPNIQRNPIRVCRENRWDPPIADCYPMCGIKHPVGVANIVNGTDVQIGDYPWQVGIYYNDTKKFLCGGSVIDQNVILTAAHCVTDYDGNVQPASKYLVAAGKYYRQYDQDEDLLAQYSSISAIHVPERYSGRFNQFALDIAILILSNPFTLSDAVQPVCIELNEVSSYISLSPYDEGIVTGWGYTQETGVLSDVLKELVIPFIPFNKCFNEIPIDFKRYFTQDKICGGYKDNATSICRGDSGGALVFKNMFSDRYFVRGIVSTSPATTSATCDSNQYSLYTNVNNHINFVREVVAINQLRKHLECFSDDFANEQNTEERIQLTKGCLLPNMPHHGEYKLLNNTTMYVPGNYVLPATQVTVICNDGYTVVPIDTNSSICADTGNWQPQLPTCKHLGNIRIVCYYGSWSIYRSGIGRFTPKNINPHLCTHIIYTFGNFTNDYMFTPIDIYADITRGGYAKFTGLKAYNKDLKTLLALGGGVEGGLRFSAMVENSTKRSIFIQNSIEFLRQHNFDGLSFSMLWQFPLLKDRDNFSLLIQELREEYESESKETGLPRLLLSISLPTYIKEGYDVPKLIKYVDWANVRTYDYHLRSEPSVNHHSKLYSEKGSDNHVKDVDYTINEYLEFDVQRNKLLLGIPNYGRTFTLKDSNMTDIGSPAIVPDPAALHRSEESILSYNEICTNIKNEGWIVKHRYPQEMGPYAYNGNQWVCYDDENIVRKKSQYAVENNLGGIFFWMMEMDDFHGTCTGKQFPLITAAKEALLLAVQEQ